MRRKTQVKIEAVHDNAKTDVEDCPRLSSVALGCFILRPIQIGHRHDLVSCVPHADGVLLSGPKSCFGCSYRYPPRLLTLLVERFPFFNPSFGSCPSFL